LISPEYVEAELRRLLGLSSYEARAYIVALQGVRKPRDIARESNIPHQRIYDVLRRLVDRGLLTRVGDEYLAVSPAEAMARIAQRMLVEAGKRAREIESLGSYLEGLARETPDEYIVTLAGVEESIAAALSVLERCGEPPMFMVYKAAERLRDLYPHLRPLMGKAMARGATVLVYEAINVPREVVEEFERGGGRIVKAREAIVDLMVACDTVIIGVPSARINGVVSVVIKNSRFAQGIKERLREAIDRITGGLGRGR